MNHLDWLESQAIHILRESVAESANPVLLFSAGKDSTVLAHAERYGFKLIVHANEAGRAARNASRRFATDSSGRRSAAAER